MENLRTKMIEFIKAFQEEALVQSNEHRLWPEVTIEQKEAGALSFGVGYFDNDKVLVYEKRAEDGGLGELVGFNIPVEKAVDDFLKKVFSHGSQSGRGPRDLKGAGQDEKE
jgi:hypothetical protein